MLNSSANFFLGHRKFIFLVRFGKINISNFFEIFVWAKNIDYRDCHSNFLMKTCCYMPKYFSVALIKQLRYSNESNSSANRTEYTEYTKNRPKNLYLCAENRR